MQAVVDQLLRLGKRELIYLLLITCNYVVSVRRGFLFLWVLGMGYVILLWHFLSLPYNYFEALNFVWLYYYHITVKLSICLEMKGEANSTFFYNSFEKSVYWHILVILLLNPPSDASVCKIKD